MSSSKKRVALVGSGNWGSALAKLIAENTMRLADKYEAEVRMWVFEEEVNGRKLTEIINKDHENVKYLPGIKLPPNVIAEPDLVKTVENADMILFVLPHQFIDRTCKQLSGKIKKGAIACSAIKGLTNSAEDKSLGLISQLIAKGLGIECGVLMGANIANEVAEERFCETNIGFKDHKNGAPWKELVQTPNFRVVLVKEVEQVELCGALKNIVAVAAGFIDGLYGPDSSNTKAAIIRIGLMEMIKFNEQFFPGGKRDVYFESCGVADLITTCFGGRNRKVAEAFAKNPKRTIEDFEKEMLNGQRLQGPQTAEEVNAFLKMKKAEDKFPLFTAVHRICKKEKEPSYIVEAVKAHPEHHGGEHMHEEERDPSSGL